MGKEHALVAGGHGLVGRYVTRQLLASGRWDQVTTSSRRPGQVADGADHLTLDLLDGPAVTAAVPGTVTHLFFAAYLVVAYRREEVVANVAMLQNTIDALAERGAPLRHVVLYQGGKAYGAHLGPFRIPARESDPRILGPLFYYDQEDALRRLSAERGIRFTVFRPDHIMGVANGHFVNLLHAVAVYAAVSKELGLPLRFPGSERASRALIQLCDARLLGRASEWAVDCPAAADEVFNVTNGDQARYCDLWPLVADDFGMRTGEPMKIRLAEAMPAHADAWQRLVVRHGLRPTGIEDMTNWGWADATLGIEHDILSSTVKLRRAGFADCIDSEESVLQLLADMRAEGLLPTYR